MESPAMDLFFLFIGLGFFIAMIMFVNSSNERSWQQRVDEAREFGFEGSRLQAQAKPRSIRRFF